MALLINKSKPAGSDAPSTLDNEQRTLRTAIQDIFGVPDNTTLSNAGMSFLAGGLATINLSAATVTAGTVLDIAAGHAQRDLVTSVGMGMNMQADTWDINAAGNGETVAVGSLVFLGIPTWTSTGTSYTVTDAATLYIHGAPVDSTNVTATNSHALLVAAGTTTLGGLLDISGASAGQIKFPGTQNVSADANTLDDYEEGAWTLTLSDGTNTSTAMSENAGRYIKIGRHVTITGGLTTTSLAGTPGSLSGSLQVTGLPFAAETGAAHASGVTGVNSAGFTLTAGENVTGLISDGASAITLTVWNAVAGTGAMQESEWTADGSLRFYGTYLATD